MGSAVGWYGGMALFDQFSGEAKGKLEQDGSSLLLAYYVGEIPKRRRDGQSTIDDFFGPRGSNSQKIPEPESPSIVFVDKNNAWQGSAALIDVEWKTRDAIIRSKATDKSPMPVKIQLLRRGPQDDAIWAPELISGILHPSLDAELGALREEWVQRNGNAEQVAELPMRAQAELMSKGLENAKYLTPEMVAATLVRMMPRGGLGDPRFNADRTEDTVNRWKREQQEIKDVCTSVPGYLDLLLRGTEKFQNFQAVTATYGKPDKNRLEYVFPMVLDNSDPEVRKRLCDHPYTQELIKAGNKEFLNAALNSPYPDVRIEVLRQNFKWLGSRTNLNFLKNALRSDQDIQVQRFLLNVANQRSADLLLSNYGVDYSINGTKPPGFLARHMLLDGLAGNSHPEIVRGVLASLKPNQEEDVRFRESTPAMMSSTQYQTARSDQGWEARAYRDRLYKEFKGQKVVPWASSILGKIAQNSDFGVHADLVRMMKNDQYNDLFKDPITLTALSSSWNLEVRQAAETKAKADWANYRFTSTYSTLKENIKAHGNMGDVSQMMSQTNQPSVARSPTSRSSREAATALATYLKDGVKSRVNSFKTKIG
jgi:hypothetical protein